MNYASELKKFVTSQYIYSGVRIALAIVIPSILLAYFGVLEKYFLFPLGTSLLGYTDQPGPFIRRRNSLILALFFFISVAAIANLVKDIPVLLYAEIIVFGMFFSIIGVYGARLASVGSLTLVVLSIFIDGHLSGPNLMQSLIVFSSGGLWFLLIFMVVTTMQPYKLAGQMIGENYLELANYLRLKSKFYDKTPDYDTLFHQLISAQVSIRDQQEATRETVFKTRAIVNEATTTSRLLMVMFLNSIDLHEKLMTSENDYKKIQQLFGEEKILGEIKDYLLALANELQNIGIALQSGTKAQPVTDIEAGLNKVYDSYFDLRIRIMSSDNLENLMILRQILQRVSDVGNEVKTIYTFFYQDKELAKSISTGLDLEKFLPGEKLNLAVLKENLSLNSGYFRHAIRITVALLLGYIISKFSFLGIGHSYWILITTLAILKPSYSITKSRNLLRLYGTVTGAVLAYLLLTTVQDGTTLLSLLLICMILCFTFLKRNYFWAVFFMTLYIFISFNFLSPGNINKIFKDRILDTGIAALVTVLVSNFVFPLWERTQNVLLMKKSLKSNISYFSMVMRKFGGTLPETQKYKIIRKNAIVNLANLSDNFQKMISDPKDQKKELETIHQFVTTSHLITAYTASLSQFYHKEDLFPEIDFESWSRKIIAEMDVTYQLLETQTWNTEKTSERHLVPEDSIENLLEKRKKEIEEEEYTDRRDPARITRLTELKNIREILVLIYDVAKEQRKLVEKFYRNQSTTQKQ